MYELSLEGKVAFVTGGNGGLGESIAIGLQDAGARIAVTGRDADKNAAVGEKFAAGALVLEVDVREEAAVINAVQSVASEMGRLDILVNCAGSFHGGALTVLSLEGWNSVVGSHLTGSFLTSREAAKVMTERQNGGKIINVGSMYSLFGAPDFSDYAAAKTGIIGLARSLAVQLGKYSIQVNAILPGWYETDMIRGMPETPLGEEIRRRTPLSRWGSPSDLTALLSAGH
jgi:2-deoxy-D-gluconate 3-dehydrogenase